MFDMRSFLFFVRKGFNLLHVRIGICQDNARGPSPFGDWGEESKKVLSTRIYALTWVCCRWSSTDSIALLSNRVFIPGFGCSLMSFCVKSLSGSSLCRRSVEFQRFLTELSVLPGSSRAMSAHFVPIFLIACRMIWSSPIVQFSLLICGSR
jgi:hypothetical protein